MTAPALLAGLGARAPAGDARVHWLLGQRIAREELSLAGLLGLCTQSLGIVVRADGVAADPRTLAATGTVRQALERALAQRDLNFAVRDGALWVGCAEFVSGREHAAAAPVPVAGASASCWQPGDFGIIVVTSPFVAVLGTGTIGLGGKLPISLPGVVVTAGSPGAITFMSAAIDLTTFTVRGVSAPTRWPRN